MEQELRERLAAVLAGAGADVPDAGVLEITVPPEPAHGDLSTNAALIYAQQLGRPPRPLAEELAAAARGLPAVTRAEVAGPGFVNVHLADEVILGALADAVKGGNDYGRSNAGRRRKVQVEFVSANPTGPLNAVSARAAAFGDALARLLAFTGYDAAREFYVCDVGTQIDLLGVSVCERFKESATGEAAAIPAEGYHGAYVADLAASLARAGRLTRETDPAAAGRAAAEEVVKVQAAALDSFRVGAVNWFRESDLYAAAKVDGARKRLEGRGVTYEHDGALWLQTTAAGDDEDRVLVRADGRPTYFLADVAYHLDKFDRGFTLVIDVLGPDHHGHVKKMLAAVSLLGLPAGWLEIIISQQVNLVEGGAKVKMSKRAGAVVPMTELVANPGVDASRFFFLMRSAASHLDFDLELARKQSLENPVYYVQYSHARVAGILREAGELAAGAPTAGDAAALDLPEERVIARKVWEFPRVVGAAAARREPHRVAAFATELASLFHNYYQHNRIIRAATPAQVRGRLLLTRAVGQTVRNALELLGVSAPTSM